MGNFIPIKSPDKAAASAAPSSSKKNSLQELQKDTHFSNVEIGQLYTIFNQLSKGGTTPLDRSRFQKGLAMAGVKETV
jgi:Ca2+-binding EF-hand superfamily protein